MDDKPSTCLLRIVQLCVGMAGCAPTLVVARAPAAHPERIAYIHLKDVDGDILDAVRRDAVDFNTAIRRRVFTELGRGRLDITALLAALRDIDYDGWLMVEQDSSWGPPSEAAAIGRRVLAASLRTLGAASEDRPDAVARHCP